MDLTSDISPPLAFTQAGPREKNEDSIFPAQDQVTERDHLFIVCDGVGGALKGELASQTATTSFAAYLAVQPPGTEIGSDYLNAGLRYVEQQFDALFTEQFLLKGMATTLVMLLLPPGGGRPSLTWAIAGPIRLGRGASSFRPTTIPWWATWYGPGSWRPPMRRRTPRRM